MRYTYTLYKRVPESVTYPLGYMRVDTCTRFVDLEHQIEKIDPTLSKHFVTVFDNVKSESTAQFTTPDDVAAWRQTLERVAAWKPFDEAETGIHMAGDVGMAEAEPTKIQKAVNPSHYQAFFGGHDMPELQWLEAQQYTHKYKDPEIFVHAVELQARKYIDRLGGKDKEVQELLKAVWYLKFIAAYIQNGYKPIRVKDIDKILASA